MKTKTAIPKWIYLLLRAYVMLLITALCGIPIGYSQKLTIYANQPTVNLSPNLYGLFFEDINFGADGGLYAELIQNRSFEYFPVFGRLNDAGHLLQPMTAWEQTFLDSAQGHIYVTRRFPLNNMNANNLEMLVKNNKGFMGVSNTGYDGIPLVKGDKYDLSFYVRWEANRGNKYDAQKVKVLLQGDDGEVLDSAAWDRSSFTGAWSKLNHEFSPVSSARNAKLTVLVHGQGRMQFDMISLLPQNTFKQRKNGLRKDVVKALQELNPSFLRFPGGCILHGDGLENTYQWKHTVGDLAMRKPNWNRWGYHQTNGLGYYEYFLLCEDLGMQPLPVVPVGVSCSLCEYECVPMDKLHEVIQDALDLVEFANGSVTSKWGKLRADLGHPEPFKLQYVCLGNEEGELPEFKERIPEFVKAFKHKYPTIKLIGTSGLSPKVTLYPLMTELNVWSSDEHYYQAPEWFIENQNRFDNWDRNKPKVFIGEYASRGNTLFNAVSEAIYLTGVERNADMVEMTCYAPLLARYGNTQWKAANLIYFNNGQVVKTPNYYVQQMFSVNKGDVYLKNKKEAWPGKELAVSTTLDKASGEVIIKIANAYAEAKQLTIVTDALQQVSRAAKLTQLSGDKGATNDLQNPDNIKPVTSIISAGKNFSITIPAFSVQILRIGVKTI